MKCITTRWGLLISVYLTFFVNASYALPYKRNMGLKIQVQDKNKIIKGKVVDENDNPIGQASVTVKNSSIGTATMDNGEFTLEVSDDKNTVLIITAIGYEPNEVTVNSSDIIIRMRKIENNLDDVIVVGYGTVKKADFTGSANQVSYKDFKDRPILNPLNALVATGPGLQTTAAGGSPGSSPGIRIRGFGSINGEAGPLYVVDGVVYEGGVANLNTDDIETITTLKDAATIALYGARGANGVVMITTKRGRDGRNNVSFKVLQGVSGRAIPEYKRVNAFQYYPLMWESMKNALTHPATGTALSEQEAAEKATLEIKSRGLLYNPFRGVADDAIVGIDGKLNPNATDLLWADDLDWNKDLMRTGYRQEYNLTISGGNKKSDYFGSFGYVNEKGYLIRSDWERFTGRLNVNTQALKWFKTGLNMSTAISKSNQASDGSSTGYVNPFFFTRNMGPIYPVYAHNQTTGEYLLDEFGQRFYDYGNLGGTDLGVPNRASGASPGRHVVEETKLNKSLFKRNIISGRAYGTVMFTPWLDFTTNISVDITDYNSNSYENTKVGDGAPAGRVSKENQKTVAYTFNQLINFNKKFGYHNLTAVLGHENFDYTYNSLSGSKQEEILEGSVEFPNFAIINSLSSSETERRIESYFARANYDFDNKYYFTANIRRDGNSRFAPDVRWSNFWGLSGAWRMDNENFLKSASWINSLKLRASYGELGNENIGTSYAYQGLYTLGRNNANEPGAVQSQLPNPFIAWETIQTFDIGLEFGLFQNRLNGTIEYYNRNSHELIFDINLPLSVGGWEVPTNIGNMFNKGFEFELNGDIIRKPEFTWNLGVNGTTIKNRITKMPEQNPEIISGTKKLSEGHSIYDFWLRQWYGVDPADGAALFYAETENNAWKDPTSGNLKSSYRIMGQDTLTTDQNSALYAYNGTAIPKIYGGVENTIRYKNFSLNFLIQFQIGGKVYDGTYASLMHSGTYGAALHEDILNRWTTPGQITDVPRMQNNANSTFSAQSTRFLIDASFLNIRSATLSYNLPSSWLSRIEAQTGSIFIGSENIALFSKRKGTNINQSFTGTNSNVYTPARIITAGINLNF